MRTLGIVSSLALASATLLAQAPVSSASGPIVPEKAEAEGSSFEFRVGGIMISAERNFQVGTATPSTTTGAVKGVDVLLRGSGGGIQFRSLTSSFGKTPQVISADARLLLGVPEFTINVGGSRRVFYTSASNNAKYDFGVAGVSMTFHVGGTGLRVLVSGDGYVPFGSASKTMKTGLEGEAGVIYTLPMVPIFLQVGYRTEVFTALAGTVESPEEIRGIRLGGGIQFGGR